MKRRDRDKKSNHGGTPPPEVEGRERSSDPIKRQVQGNIDVRGAIQANLPTNLIDEYRLAVERAEGREKRRFWWDRVSLIVAGVGILLTLLLAIAALRGNRIARISLVSTQRAYITFQQIKPNRVTVKDHPEFTTLNFRLIWQNSGTTPATRVVSFFAET
jgi:hypothetical protein